MEAAAARLGVQLIKQFPAKEQAELKVKVQIPGSWFGGSLTPDEKRELYWVQAAPAERPSLVGMPHWANLYNNIVV